MINGKDIYAEIRQAIKDYDAKNWEDFGYQIGEASAKIILGEQSEKQIAVAQMMQGMIEPFGGKFNLEALLMCIYDEDQAALILDEAYNQFKAAYEQKNVQDVVAGVILTVAGVKQIQKGLPACEAVDTKTWDFNGFSKSMDIMAHPVEHFKIIEEDLLVHGTSIMKDAFIATMAYENGDLYTFGQQMGKIFKLATNVAQNQVAQVKETIDRKMVTEVAQGLLEGTKVGHFDFTALLFCIYEADQAALILYEGVQIIEEAYA